jgi:hypothetical protein
MGGDSSLRAAHIWRCPEPVDPVTPTLDAVPIGWFAGRNGWVGALLGIVVAITWLVVTGQSWFVLQIVVVGALLSAGFGSLASIPALLVARACSRWALVAAGCVFACTSFAVQAGLMTTSPVGSPSRWGLQRRHGPTPASSATRSPPAAEPPRARCACSTHSGNPCTRVTAHRHHHRRRRRPRQRPHRLAPIRTQTRTQPRIHHRARNGSTPLHLQPRPIHPSRPHRRRRR